MNRTDFGSPIYVGVALNSVLVPLVRRPHGLRDPCVCYLEFITWILIGSYMYLLLSILYKRGSGGGRVSLHTKRIHTGGQNALVGIFTDIPNPRSCVISVLNLPPPNGFCNGCL